MTGDLVRTRTNENTITLKCYGEEKVVKVARDVKVTMNGHKGYSLDDLGHCTLGATRVTLTLTNGLAKSLDVTLKLREGEKLWSPGMSPGQITRRRVLEIMRQSKEQDRQRDR